MHRVLHMGDAVSAILETIRGITAGSGFATFEMRLAMINIVDRAVACFGIAHPTVSVDDGSADSFGDRQQIEYAVGGFGLAVCFMLTGCGMEVSVTNWICTASSDSLGRNVSVRMLTFGIKYTKAVKSLGAGMAGGNRRAVHVNRKRLRAFQARARGVAK